MRANVVFKGDTDPLLSYSVFVFFHVNILMHILFLSLNFYLYCKQGQNKLFCSCSYFIRDIHPDVRIFVCVNI